MQGNLRPRPTYLLFLALALLAAATTLPTRAQDPATGLPPVYSPKPNAQSAPAEEQPSPIRVQSKLVVTPVTVIDRSGDFVYGLTRKDFEILDNGVPQHLESFESEASTISLVVVVQVSRSVEGLLDQVRPLGSVFSSLVLGPKGQAAVLTYSDRVNMVQDFSDDGDKLATTLRRITAEGSGSRLNDALMRGIALLERRPKTERRVLVVFSDAHESGSETNSREVLRRATGSEVAIYGLRFSPAESLLTRKPQDSGPSPFDANIAMPTPPGTVPTPSASASIHNAPIPVVDIVTATGEILRSTLFSNVLEYYAGYTGGLYYKHWKKAEVEDQLNHIATEIHSQYQLAYIPDTLSQEGFHKIEVKVYRANVKVRARAGYFYQAPSSNPPSSASGQPQ